MRLRKVAIRLAKLKNSAIGIVPWLSLSGTVAVVIVTTRLWPQTALDNTGRSLLVSACVASFSIALGLFTYHWNKRVDRFQFGNEKRHAFIFNDLFQNIRSRIEHDDIELQTIVAAVNAPNPYEPDLLPCASTKRLHEDFDNYLNWIEGFAILWKNGGIEDAELRGLWQYYIRRLSEVTIKKEQIEQELSQKWNYDRDKVNSFFKDREEKSDFKYLKNPLEKCRQIDPITQPIWFYINRPEYNFKAIVDIVEYVVLVL